MNHAHPPESSSKANKLIVRSEVLAVLRHLVSLTNPSKQERNKQLKRLQDLEALDHVQDILLKELVRANSSEIMQIITQFLMELGEYEYLKDKLWNIIEDPKTSDDLKDISNLILRHLGDPSDPDLYLDYLEDPQGLIGRETVRMLEVSSENPEALIDFIDFIMSLTLDDQQRLLKSLHGDYPSEYLVNLYIPILESDPAPELWEILVVQLGETRSPKAAKLLDRLLQWPADKLPLPRKTIEIALKQLQLKGLYHPDSDTPTLEEEPLHAVVQSATPFECYLTLCDGIGNQGLLFSRQRPNGDVAMLSVALNDQHGIIDCFGFYELTVSDFHRIVDKFHEGATKIKVSPEYCAYKLWLAETKNHENYYRLPYEYRCWQPLLDDLPAQPPDDYNQWIQWVKPEWHAETQNLYEHPDFQSWFLEQGDDPEVSRLLHRVTLLAQAMLDEGSLELSDCLTQLDSLASELSIHLWQSPWRELMIQRLIEAAYLLHCQNIHTFRNLAATEAYKLVHLDSADQLMYGFLKAYGRRCITEELLRLRMGDSEYDKLTPLVDEIVQHWES